MKLLKMVGVTSPKNLSSPMRLLAKNFYEQESKISERVFLEKWRVGEVTHIPLKNSDVEFQGHLCNC